MKTLLYILPLLLCVLVFPRLCGAGGGPFSSVTHLCNVNDLAGLSVEGNTLVVTTRAGGAWTALLQDLLVSPSLEGARDLPARSFRPGVLSSLPAELDLHEGFPVAKTLYMKGELLFATLGGGLRSPGRSAEPVPGSPPIVRDLLVFGDRVWLATSEGLGCYAEGKVRMYRRETGLPVDHVSALTWDGSALWIAFFDGGICRMEGNYCRPYKTLGGIQASWINASAWDGQTVWVGSEAGLGVVEEASRSVIPVEGFTEKILALHASPAGLLVAGERRAARKTGGEWEHFDFPNDYLQAVHAHNGTLWIAGMSGLLSFDGTTWHRYSLFNGKLHASWITALCSWKDGILAGAYDRGVAHLDSRGGFRVLKPNLCVNYHGMMVMENHLYVSTLDQGLWRYDGTRWLPLGETYSVLGGTTTALETGDGKLFVGTDHGLVILKVSK